jgi:hypothetical protein
MNRGGAGSGPASPAARRRRAGDRVRLELRRGDASRTVELALRALI